MSETPEAPTDPMTPAEESFSSLREIYKSLRKAGFSLIEAIVFLAASLAINNPANQGDKE